MLHSGLSDLLEETHSALQGRNTGKQRKKVREILKAFGGIERR